MARTPIHALTARRMSRAAQLGAGVVVTLAAGLWAFQIPGMQVAPPEPEPVKPAPGGESTSSGGSSGSDAVTDGELKELAIRLDSARKKAPPPEEKPKADESEDVKVDTGGWKYLGSIIEPDRRLALVSIAGKQRLLSPGSEVDGVLVVDVADDDVLVSDDSGERLIPKESRPSEGGRVNWVAVAASGGGAEVVASKAVIVPTGQSPSTIKVDPRAQERDARQRWMSDPERRDRIARWQREREQRRRETVGGDVPPAPGQPAAGAPGRGQTSAPIQAQFRLDTPQRMNGTPNGGGRGGN